MHRADTDKTLMDFTKQKDGILQLLPHSSHMCNKCLLVTEWQMIQHGYILVPISQYIP